MLLPENAIVVVECPTTEPAIYQHTEKAQGARYLQATTGGAIGSGLPVALGAAIACPGRKTVLFEGDGSGMYTNERSGPWRGKRPMSLLSSSRTTTTQFWKSNWAGSRSDSDDKMQSMMNLNNPTLDWVKIAEGQGVSPAPPPPRKNSINSSENGGIGTKGPCLIEAQIAPDVQPMIDLIRRSK